MGGRQDEMSQTRITVNNQQITWNKTTGEPVQSMILLNQHVANRLFLLIILITYTYYTGTVLLPAGHLAISPIF